METSLNNVSFRLLQILTPWRHMCNSNVHINNSNNYYNNINNILH